MASSSSKMDAYPSYNALRRSQRPRLNPECRKLLWSLQAPFSTALFVSNNRCDPLASREAYFRQTLAGTTWHPISALPLTEPAVSSVVVRVGALEAWEDEWLEAHCHAAPELEGCVYGALDGIDPDERELIECCGTKRPRTVPRLIVSAWEKPYVTIHDYISALHPWLVSMRDDLITAKNVSEAKPLAHTTRLLVNVDSPDLLTVDTEEYSLGPIRGLNTAAKAALAFDGPATYVSSASLRRASVVA